MSLSNLRKKMQWRMHLEAIWRGSMNKARDRLWRIAQTSRMESFAREAESSSSMCLSARLTATARVYPN
jgi:hypothetical protein